MKKINQVISKENIEVLAQQKALEVANSHWSEAARQLVIMEELQFDSYMHGQFNMSAVFRDAQVYAKRMIRDKGMEEDVVSHFNKIKSGEVSLY